MSKSVSSEILRFKFDSRMATLLGEQSVSNSVAAVFELVKNAYDADATLAEVIFYGKRDAQNRLLITKILVKDNGVGMTFEDFRDKWMVVGTYAKERDVISPKFARRVAGEKGIGRFATQRLGQTVTIVSDPEDLSDRATKYPGKRIIMTIDWNRYRPGTTFDEIDNTVRFIDKPPSANSGLEITIEGLKDEWTEDRIKALNERLGWLVLPPELAKESKHKFDARVITEGFVVQRLEIEPKFLRMAPYSIETKLHENAIQYKISKEGELVQDSRRGKDGQAPVDFPAHCGDAEFRLYYYPGDVGSEDRYERYYKKALGAAEFENRLKNFAGVKIYNSGIRVLPYGNPGNDWLGFNYMYSLRRGGALRNERVIGFLLISKEGNPQIRETTTRESVFENEAFRELQQFAIRSMRLLATFYDQDKESKKKANLGASAAGRIVDETRAIRSDVEELPIPEQTKKEVNARLQKISTQVSQMQAEYERKVVGYEEEQQLYRNLASVGITTVAFAHEILNPLSSTNLTVRNMVNDFRLEKIDREKHLRDLIEIAARTGNLLHWTKYIRAFASLLATSKRTEREEIRFKTFIEDMFVSFQGVLRERKIEVKNSVPEWLPTLWINRADLESIVVNLFTNSVKALRAVNDRKRVIEVTVEDNPAAFEFRFSDTGVGIPPSEVKRIFEPLYTTYRGQNGEPEGTGMGLTIITEILEQYGGRIRVEKPVFEKGATFSVIIPWKEIQKSAAQ